MRLRLAFLFLLASPAIAQSVAWTAFGEPSPGSRIDGIDAIGDFDGDGGGDIAMGARVSDIVAPTLRILSGATGAVLFPGPGDPTIVAGVVLGTGDVDGDGAPDIATLSGTSTSRFLHCWSPARRQMLWTGGPFTTSFWSGLFLNRIAGGLDVDADGRCEVVALSSSSVDSNVYLINSDGSLRYTIPAFNLGWIAESVDAMPDLDGDGGDDFVVGAHMPGVMGGVFAFSGRTGAILHFSAGIQPGDALSGAVCDAGDVDGDGIHDYAAATYIPVPTNRIALFSGADGAWIRDYAYRAGDDAMVGDLDVDFDGVPDLVIGNSAAQVTTNVFGQVRCFSGRDGSVLWNHNSTSSSNRVDPKNISLLGPQPGSPYPVVAWLDPNYLNTGTGSIGRVTALRTSLPGLGRVYDAAFSTTGTHPLIGFKPTPMGVQVHAADAPPGALAWLILGGGSQTSYGGVTVPMQLDPFGLPGLTLLVAPFLTTTGVAGTQGNDAGYTSVVLPVSRLDPFGIHFAAQWLFLDPPTGAYAITDRHDFRFR